MAFFRSFRNRLARRIAAPAADVPASRRDFFRHAAGAGAAALGAGLLLPEDAWAGVEERAARFGITPGTLVDAQGRPMEPSRAFSDPFLGAMVAFGFNFAPRGWAMCNGQLLPIAQNSALFSLLGTIYGGDGRTTFALPDLRGRAAIQHGQGPGLSSYRLGERGGAETVTLATAQMPAHTHALENEVEVIPRSGFSQVGNDGPTRIVASHTPSEDVFNEATTGTGGSQSHENRPPYLAVNWCIALQGIFPSRS